MPEVFAPKKALLLSLKQPERVTQIILKAQRLQDGRLAVKHDDPNYQILKNLGVKVQGYEPIRHYYNAPKIRGLYDPMWHQKETYAFLTAHKKCFVFNEMALGKTASALWAADYFIEKKIISKVLVICTLSTINSTWRNEVFSIFPNRSAVSLHGSNDKCKKLLDLEGVDFYLINHDGIRVRKKLLELAKFDLIIVDEGSKFGNAGTERFDSLYELITPQMRVWWMTGTPTAKGPETAWAQCKIICPERVPQFFNAWRHKTMLRINAVRWAPRHDWKETVFEAMQPAIRFKKSDVLDLPPITYIFREATLSKEQEAVAAELKAEGAMQYGGQGLSAANGGVMAIKMRQIYCGAVKDDTGEIIQLDYKPRFDVLLEVIEEAQSKVIVFVPFTHSLNRIADDLVKAGYTVGIIDGSVKKKDRDDILDAFSGHPTPEILVANPEAAAHGLNLTAADTIVWFAPNNSSEVYVQANERINRPGQKLAMRIVHIFCAPTEAKRYKGLQDNQSEADMLLDMYREMYGKDFKFKSTAKDMTA